MTDSVDYQLLFRATPDNFLLISPDPEAIILDNTDSHVAVSLKDRSAVIGQPFFTAYPAADARTGAIIAQSHAYVRQYRAPHSMPLIRYDLAPTAGTDTFEERYWQATHYPVLDEQGGLRYILQRTQDVTEQHLADLRNRQIQQALAESQARTHFIQESLPVMVWTARPDGSIDYFNQRLYQFSGYSAAELLDWGWADFIHPDDQAQTLARWQEACAQGTDYQAEYRLRRADGQYRWLQVHGTPRLNAEGKILMWVGGATDIHKQKQMVQELLQTNEEQAVLSDQAYQAYQLAESQRETFHNLFMQTPALICILRGTDHRYEFVNPGYQKLFPQRELLGRTVAEALPEVVEQGFIDLLNGVYETGKTFVGNELPIKLDEDNSGELRQRYLNFTYQLFFENGVKAGITVFAFDVTDLVQARKTLEAATNSARPQ